MLQYLLQILIAGPASSPVQCHGGVSRAQHNGGDTHVRSLKVSAHLSILKERPKLQIHDAERVGWALIFRKYDLQCGAWSSIDSVSVAKPIPDDLLDRFVFPV